jgi:hypothetical protein
METNGRPRRRFFGKLSRVMVGIGGMITAVVVPELRAATPGSTPAATTALLPEALELPLATVNTLYTQALSDADVALLISSLVTTGRLDPPTKSHDVSLDAGNRAQTVTLPVRSYADGSTLAYICYGGAIRPPATVRRLLCRSVEWSRPRARSTSPAVGAWPKARGPSTTRCSSQRCFPTSISKHASSTETPAPRSVRGLLVKPGRRDSCARSGRRSKT